MIMYHYNKTKLFRLIKTNYLKFDSRNYSTINTPINDSFSIYIHWPYCERKCHYCSFNKYVQPNPDIPKLINSYQIEITNYLNKINKKFLKSIYFGGGTPSLAPIDAIETILNKINSIIPIPKECEITLEANPNKLETEKLKRFRSIEINRVSIGIQSFDDRRLQQMGRDHSSEEARNCLNLVNQLFPKSNFDMIFAHPNQTLEEWKTDLDTALSFNPSHMSIYQLMIEAGTPYYKSVKKGKLELLSDEIMEDMYWHNIEKLKSFGIYQYEASNFSKSGHESIHNSGYWSGIEYIGIGPGAHGRVSFNNQSTNYKDRLCRTFNIMSPNAWMNQCETIGNGLAKIEPMDFEEILKEKIVFGLRTRDGISNLTLSTATQNQSKFQKMLNMDQVNIFVQQGFLEYEPQLNQGTLRPTPQGLAVIDSILTSIL